MATTNTNPDGAAVLRARLAAVSLALRPVHRTLVEGVRRAYERANGRVDGPLALLQLVTVDPFFAWLHPLSELMVRIDEIAETPDGPAAAEVAAVRRALEDLLAPAGEPSAAFAAHYRAALQDDPSLVVAHAALRPALEALPTS